MNHSEISSLRSFLKQSPTAFHACQNIANMLSNAGFESLDERTNWSLKPHGKYYVTRNDSAIIGFRLGKNINDAMTMIGAHTDSPCLKPKPNSISQSNGYSQCQVHVYGGALLNPWFDRDLSLAGKVIYQDKDTKLHSTIMDIEKPIAIIPSLAIHLDRNANNDRSINAQLHLPPILSAETDSDINMGAFLAQHIRQRNGIESVKVLDFDLCFYDTQAPALIGLHEDLLASARLDNLLSCFCASQSIINSDDSQPALVVFTDHEEVGSQSQCGAQGSFLSDVISRICQTHQEKTHFIRQSMMFSVDNAHAIHPNHPDKHDKYHAPILGKGIVIKHNANQRYATNAESAAVCRKIASDHGLPLQDMVVRNDMACGSTIGPIISSEIGITTVDIGIPQLAMHSIRELAHINDIVTMIDFLTLSINQIPKIDSST